MSYSVFEELTFVNFKEFYKDISPYGDLFNTLSNGFIFRGEGSDLYTLLPSALRDRAKIYFDCINKGGLSEKFESGQIFKEYSIVKKFYLSANKQGIGLPYSKLLLNNTDELGLEIFNNDNLIWIPYELYDIVALAQHYGIPTRLLDWTHDIYTSLYFATSSVLKKKNPVGEYFVIWALNHSLLSLVSLFKNPMFRIKFITPKYDKNQNIQAQRGILTFLEIQDNSVFSKKLTERMPFDEYIKNNINNYDNSEPILFKFKIPISEAKEAFEIAEKMGYNAARLFSGLSGIQKALYEKCIFYGHLC